MIEDRIIEVEVEVGEEVTTEGIISTTDLRTVLWTNLTTPGI